MRIALVLFSIALICGSLNARAEEPDAASQEALAKTQQLLNTPELRDQAIDQSASAQAADRQVRSLVGGGAGRDEVYHLSGEVMNDLVMQTGGDPQKMKQILEQAN